MKRIKARKDHDLNITCPGCEKTAWENGPAAGGHCVNIKCIGCGARWNWIIAFGEMQPLNEVAEKVIEKFEAQVQASIIKNTAKQ